MRQQKTAGSRGPVIAASLAIAAVLAGTAAAVWAVRERERANLESGLRTTLHATVGLEMWAADQSRGVGAVAVQPRVVESVAALVSGRAANVETWGCLRRPCAGTAAMLSRTPTTVSWLRTA